MTTEEHNVNKFLFFSVSYKTTKICMVEVEFLEKYFLWIRSENGLGHQN